MTHAAHPRSHATRPPVSSVSGGGVSRAATHLGDHGLKYGRLGHLRQPIESHAQNAVRHKALRAPSTWSGARAPRTARTTRRRDAFDRVAHQARIHVPPSAWTRLPPRQTGCWAPGRRPETRHQSPPPQSCCQSRTASRCHTHTRRRHRCTPSKHAHDHRVCTRVCAARTTSATA